MKRRRWPRFLAGFLLLVAVAYFFLVRFKHSTPTDCAWKLDMAAVRAAASAVPGDRPTEVREDSIVSFRFPLAIVAAGQSWSTVEQRVFVYEIVYADRTIVIDSGMTEEQAHSTLGKDAAYDGQAWGRADRAMRAASAIYVTHEHPDHLAGLLSEPPEVLARARLNQEQFDHLADLKDVSTPEARAALKPTAFAPVQGIAPGVVLVKAPGHTPGSQMVFVQLADGKEVLLTGDTAWRMLNIKEEQGPARFVSMAMHSDADNLQCQLAALDKLDDGDRNVSVVPGHDPERVAALVASGKLVAGLR